jgi:hypothetical protein
VSDLLHFEESMVRTKVSNELRNARVEGPATLTSQVRRMATLRDRLGFINLDVARMHEDSVRRLLTSETDAKVKSGLQSLLRELTENCGLGWSEIARLVKVSVPAIRKWRMGGEVSPQRLHAVAQLAAFLRILHIEGVVDPAAWLATPITPETIPSLTKAVLYADGHVIPLLAYADNHINLEQLLKLANVPLERLAPTAELVRSEDGSVSIVPLGS